MIPDNSIDTVEASLLYPTEFLSQDSSRNAQIENLKVVAKAS